MDIRKVGLNGKTKVITLPKDWCKEGEFIKIEKINDKELRLTKVE